MLLKTLQPVVPEPLVMCDPLPYRAESFGDEVVAALPSVPLLGHEAGIEQDAEMLRHRRPAHLEMSRDRVDRAVGLDEQVEHPPTRRTANRPKDVRLAIAGHRHARNISKENLTRQVRSRRRRSQTPGAIRQARMTYREADCQCTGQGADLRSEKR